jgi:hypothetical protein
MHLQSSVGDFDEIVTNTEEIVFENKLSEVGSKAVFFYDSDKLSASSGADFFNVRVLELSVLVGWFVESRSACRGSTFV